MWDENDDEPLPVEAAFGDSVSEVIQVPGRLEDRDLFLDEPHGALKHRESATDNSDGVTMDRVDLNAVQLLPVLVQLPALVGPGCQ